MTPRASVIETSGRTAPEKGVWSGLLEDYRAVSVSARRSIGLLGIGAIAALGLLDDGSGAERVALVALVAVGVATALGWFEAIGRRPLLTRFEHAPGFWPIARSEERRVGKEC